MGGQAISNGRCLSVQVFVKRKIPFTDTINTGGGIVIILHIARGIVKFAQLALVIIVSFPATLAHRLF